MKEEDIRKMVEEVYDDSRDDTLRDMLATFYSRKLRSTALFIWGWGLLFVAAAIWAAVMFFRAENTGDQILYATVFVCSYLTVGLMKVFAWQTIHRHSIKREIKRLELRMLEASEK